MHVKICAHELGCAPHNCEVVFLRTHSPCFRPMRICMSGARVCARPIRGKKGGGKGIWACSHVCKSGRKCTRG
eukprot:jgi/Botrbrau1/3431/Bobra.139_1s0011.1